MYELIRVGERTYYIDTPTKIGVYLMDNGEVCLIDSGLDESVAENTLAVLSSQAWNLGVIINTHYHADHMGGNAYLQEKTGCRILADKVTPVFATHSVLMPSILYGGYPSRELYDKFLYSEPSRVEAISAENLPHGLEILPLPGHTYEMNAVKTSDGVWFLADSVMGERAIDRNHITYTLDVESYLSSLGKLKTLDGKLFIPSHAEPVENIAPLAEKNIENVYFIIDTVKGICREPISLDGIIREIFRAYNLKINLNQYMLVSTTLRSFLSYMLDRGMLSFDFIDGNLCYKSN